MKWMVGVGVVLLLGFFLLSYFGFGLKEYLAVRGYMSGLAGAQLLCLLVMVGGLLVAPQQAQAGTGDLVCGGEWIQTDCEVDPDTGDHTCTYICSSGTGGGTCGPGTYRCNTGCCPVGNSVPCGEWYIWEDPTRYSNRPSGIATINFNINSSNFQNTYHAMWIFQDLRRAWQYIYNQSTPYYIDPGSVNAIWENGVNCYTFGCNAYSIPSHLFIPNTQVDSADIVVHEAGHRYLINANGAYAYGFCPDPHIITGASNRFCAWNEGWPNFLSIVVNLDQSSTHDCYDFGLGHCSSGSINIETLPSSASGDTVEGWVAGALLDLFDSVNEGYDSASFGFNKIAKVALLDGPFINEFTDFWYYWQDNNFETHNAVRAIYQNTIDYNEEPIVTPPDWSVPHDSSWPNAFYLPNYVTDNESPAANLTLWIDLPNDPHCNVVIDAQKYIDVFPQPNWTGSCDITIWANDTLESSFGTFTIYVTQASFADVPTSHAMYSHIESVFSNGITGGCGNNPRIYCPNSTVDRGQMAVFLLRGIHGGNYTPPPATGMMFIDVPITHQFAAWIEQLANEGITAGCGGGNYCPSNPVTRAQMSVFLLRAKHGSDYTPPPATGTMFADVPISHPLVAWIEQLANEGISSGCGNGNFCPNNSVTRAQMAVFLVNTFNLP